MGLRHVQLIETKILAGGGIGRAAEESREVLDVANVVRLDLLRECRAVMSSIMRWRNGLMALSVMAIAPVSHEVTNPVILRQDEPTCYPKMARRRRSRFAISGPQRDSCAARAAPRHSPRRGASCPRELRVPWTIAYVVRWKPMAG